MNVMSTNIQQLPIAILEAIISDLEMSEQRALANVNKYLYSIVAPIIYKDILFRWKFKEDNFKYEATERYYQALEIAMSELNINDELDYETIEVDVGRELYKEKVVKRLDELKQKLWSELQSIVKKQNKFIIGSQCINPSNLIVELESYSNLKKYRLKIDTQKGVDQLIKYRGDKFKFMEKLNLYIETDLKYDVEDFYHHLIHLEHLDINMDLFYNDLKRFSGFSSNSLTNLTICCKKLVTTELIFIIHRNFKNLKHLFIYLFELSLTLSQAELPIFENLLSFSFNTPINFDPKLLNFLSNAKFWPKLTKFYGYYFHFDRTFIFEGQWNNLTSLSAYYIDPTNLNQWNNFNQLQHLDLKMHPRTDSMMLKTIFTKLINLTTLTLFGEISSQHFDFIPYCRLLKLYINELTDFSQLFVNFLKSLVTIRKLDLNFNDNAFNNVDLNILLEEKHIFPNLRYVSLDYLPEPFQQWFLDTLNLSSIFYFEYGQFF